MKVTQRATVLEMLRSAAGRGITSGEFYAARLPRFSARILELRDTGYVIQSERLRAGSWRYTLLNEPTVWSVPPPSAGAHPPPPGPPPGGGTDQTADADRLFEPQEQAASDPIPSMYREAS